MGGQLAWSFRSQFAPYYFALCIVNFAFPRYSSPTKSGSVRLSLTVTVRGAKRKSLDDTLNVYACPVATLSNEKKPNELVVAVRTTPLESVIETVAFRRPRKSEVTIRPETVTGVPLGTTAKFAT